MGERMQADIFLFLRKVEKKMTVDDREKKKKKNWLNRWSAGVSLSQ